MEGDKEISKDDIDKKKSLIPETVFVDDVDAFMRNPENNGSASDVIAKMDEQMSRYKFMEYKLNYKKQELKLQVPDLEEAIDLIKKLKNLKDTDSEFDTQFLLSEQVFVKATVPPTDKVLLWLGANVMVEYTLDDALALLKENLNTAKKNQSCVENDLDFLRDQITTTEVNSRLVHNWEVKRRQSLKETDEN